MSNSCGSTQGQVIQMSPCPDPGWRAIFRCERGEKDLYYAEAVACWLLVTHGGTESHIHPAVAIGTVIEDATGVDDYLFVVDPDTTDTAIHKLVVEFLAAAGK